MSEEDEPSKVELAESFIVCDDYGTPREAECVKCKKRACVRAGAVYFCGRCWEFLPGLVD